MRRLRSVVLSGYLALFDPAPAQASPFIVDPGGDTTAAGNSINWQWNSGYSESPDSVGFGGGAGKAPPPLPFWPKG